MKIPTHRRAPRGFTLVEILVVIAIIATLAAVSFQVGSSVIRKGKITSSTKMANDIVFAINGFEDKYDYLPYAGSTAPNGVTTYRTDVNDLLLVLMGKEDQININEVEFFSADQAKYGRNGVVYNGDTPEALVDEFRNYFTIAIDYDGDGINTNVFYGGAFGDNVIRSKSAIVATPGANESGDPEFDEDLAVKTW